MMGSKLDNQIENSEIKMFENYSETLKQRSRPKEFYLDKRVIKNGIHGLHS
jgi:hypothetical protein